MLEHIKRSSASGQVFAQLKDQLAQGDWKPGDKLPSENELAAAMGVSRVTIRVAISRLAALGLLETRSGEGSFVREFTPGMMLGNITPALYLGENTLAEVLEYRKIIEGPTAALACEKADEEDIRELDEIYRRMERDKDKHPEFSHADFDFHKALGRITGNSLIIETYGVLEDILLSAMEKIVKQRGNRRGLYYHRLLLNAIKDRDPEACRLTMNEHIDDTYDSLIGGK